MGGPSYTLTTAKTSATPGSESHHSSDRPHLPLATESYPFSAENPPIVFAQILSLYSKDCPVYCLHLLQLALFRLLQGRVPATTFRSLQHALPKNITSIVYYDRYTLLLLANNCTRPHGGIYVIREIQPKEPSSPIEQLTLPTDTP